MTQAMTLSIVATVPVAVAAAGGLVGPQDRTRLIRAIVDVVDSCPDGVVVDLSGLDTAGAGSATLQGLPVMLAAFPARPVALVLPESLRAPVGVPVFRDRAAACAYVTDAPAPQRVAWSFSRVSEAASDARRTVTDACHEWSRDDLAGPAQLVVTELVTNAVLHAGTGMALAVTATDGGIHLAVRDGSPRPPKVDDGEPSLSPDVGRGMSLIEAFSTAWGVTPVGAGKIVWSELRAA